MSLTHRILFILLLASTSSVGLAQEQPRTGCLSGRVIDAATGAPLRGGLGLWVGQEYEYREVEGEFRLCDLRAGEYLVRGDARVVGYLPQFHPDVEVCVWDCPWSIRPDGALPVTVGGGVEPRVEFELRRGGSIAGRVTNLETGAPIADATVNLLRYDTRSTHTDQDGRYEFPTDLSGGADYRIEIQALRHFHGSSVVEVTRGSQTRFDISLRDRFGTLSGQVVDRFTGRPIPDSYVRATSGTHSGETRTDSDGRYSFEVERKPLWVYAEAEGYARQVFSCLYRCGFEDVQPIEMPPSGRLEADFELSSIELTRMIPSWSLPAGGELARLEGQGLDDVVELRMDGRPIPFRAAHQGFVEFRIPPHVLGTVTLAVLDSAGRFYELADALTYWKGSLPRRIRDVEPSSPAPGSRAPAEWAAVGDIIYYPWTGPEGRPVLMRSDGTSEGTWILEEIDSNGERLLSDLTPFGDSLYFTASTDTGSQQLWRSDGTEAGTASVRSSSGSLLHYAVNLTVIGDDMYLRAFDDEASDWVWRVDRGAAEPRKILRLFPGWFDFGQFGSLGTQVLFAAIGNEDGNEPWISDGTPGGTRLLANLNRAGGSSLPAEFTELNGKSYFAASTTEHGRELFATDGTRDGTKIVLDLKSGVGSSNPHHLVALDRHVFFLAESPRGTGIWKSDGTEKGTAFVSNGWGPLIRYKRSVFFFNETGLVSTDGTGVKTVMYVPNVLDPNDFILAGDRLWFSQRVECVEWHHCRSVWTSDGTTVGTHVVPGVKWNGSPTTVGSTACFTALDASEDFGLWCVDPSGAPRLFHRFESPRDYVPGSSPVIHLAVPERVFFSATTTAHGRELWVSDLSESGTKLLHDVNPGAGDGFVEALEVYGPRPSILPRSREAFFIGRTDETGAELWITGGTGDSTRLVTDLAPGFDTGVATLLFTLGDHVYFVGRPVREQAWGVWRSDGTSEGTALVIPSVTDALAWGDDLVFRGVRELHGCLLCRRDGATGDLEELLAWADQPATAPSEPVGVIDGRLFARSNHPDTPGLYLIERGLPPAKLLAGPVVEVREMDRNAVVITFESLSPGWGAGSFVIHVTDGTPAGTYLLGRIEGGRASVVATARAADRLFLMVPVQPLPHQYGAAERYQLWVTDGRELRYIRDFDHQVEMIGTPEGLLYFSAVEREDREIWQSDGTLEGTRLAWDVNRDGSSDAASFQLSGPYLVFGATTDSTDREPWVVQYRPLERKRPIHRRR